MKSSFPEYYPLSSADRERVSSESLIALDANALLHGYRLREAAAEEWLNLLEALADRLWVPYQAAHEYQRNRLQVVSAQNGLVQAVAGDAEKAITALKSALGKRQQPIKRSRLFDWDEVMVAVGRMAEPLAQVIADARDGVLDLDAAVGAQDLIHARLTTVLEGRVGEEPDEAWITATAGEAAERFLNRVPPGWKDQEKAREGNTLRPYGDYFLWKQLLENACREERPAILVSEERKEDWIREGAGRRLGPLPAIRKEFQMAVGQPFWMYTVAGFMEVGHHFGHEVPEPAKADARKLEAELANDGPLVVSRETRMVDLLHAIERFDDPAVVPDAALRTEVVTTLARWLEAELQSGDTPLSGPAVAPAET
jgi:hypothetical protein